MRGAASGKGAARGLTLFEVLLVVALIGVMTGGVLLGSGALGGAKLRSSATLIAAGVRLGLSRANATGRPTRMVFDFEERRVILEESATRMLREKDDGESTGAGADPATEAERAAREYAEGLVKAPRAPRARFRPMKAFGFDGDDGEAGRGLESGIVLRQVQTEHDGEPRTQGRAYLYFFPGGGTERAVIQLQQGKKDDGLTVLVNGLTGATRIERGWVELEPPRTDDDLGERSE
ncbi:MAG: prepilin-type cleavage/methylation domain-containing protein [Polyangiaceae bacterium]|nr:prepilin-type cleavage/methylation domain-containing protein [Polyangiaceae bacterium]MCW5791919.1 prepilin-type cleavage/methylation domain-containing protein [Polyangiaceae bacterium]